MKAVELDEDTKLKLERIWTDQTPDHLDPDVKRYWRWLGLIQFHIFILPFALLIIMYYSFSGAASLIGLCAVAYVILLIVAGVILLVYTNLYYDSFTFLLTEDMLLIERGVIFKTKLVVPYSRVQNVNIMQGPLQRLLGISSVYVLTAAVAYFGGNYARGAGGHLPGIPFPDELAEIIMRKVRAYKYGEGLDDDILRKDAERFVEKYRQYVRNKGRY